MKFIGFGSREESVGFGEGKNMIKIYGMKFSKNKHLKKL